MNKKGLTLVFLAAFIHGFSIFFNGLFIKNIPQTPFAFVRGIFVSVIIISIIFISPLIWKKGNELLTLSKKKWAQLALVGLIGGSVPYVLFMYGIAMIGSSDATFISKTMFIFVILMAGIFLNERENTYIGTIAATIFLGNYFLLNINIQDQSTGATLVLIATVLWSAEYIYSKYLLTSISSTSIAFGKSFFGAIFILIYLLITGEIGAITQFSIQDWSSIIISSLFLSFYVLFWYKGLKLVPVSLAVSILLIASPVTLLLESFFQHKAIHNSQIGGAIILIGALAFWIYIEKNHHEFRSSQRHIHNGP